MQKPGPQEQNENDPHSNARPDGTAVTKGLELDSKLVKEPDEEPDEKSAKEPANEAAKEPVKEPVKEPDEATFVAAVFDAAALPQLLSVLAAGLPPAADPASAAIGEQRLMAALRLLQNLSGGFRYGQEEVRPQLVQGGTIAALVRFLAQRVSNGDGAAPLGAEHERTAVDSATSTLADLLLVPDGVAGLQQAGGVLVLLPLLRAGVAAAARAVCNLAIRAPSASLPALPTLFALLAKPKAATPPVVILDCLWAVTHLYLVQPEALAAPTTLAPLAAAAVAVASSANAEVVQRAATDLLGKMTLRRDARAALLAAGAMPAVRAMLAAQRAADAQSGYFAELERLFDMLRIVAVYENE